MIKMVGSTTAITDPEKNPEDADAIKKFTFDYSYWSHADFTELEDGYFAPTSPKYADQVSLICMNLGNALLRDCILSYWVSRSL